MIAFIKSFVGFLIIGSVLLAACKSFDATPTYMLSINQSVRLSSDVVIKVDSIWDSRCPPNFYCITAGTASAKLTISKDTDSYQRWLYVRGDPTVVSFGNLVYRIVLQDVTPYPAYIAPSKDQRAFVVISRL